MKNKNNLYKDKKKAQMKIQQMAFMIIAVFLFLGMIGMIVITVMMNNIRDEVNSLREQNAKLLVSKLANSPEFSCGEVYGNQKTDCIDMDKVMMLKNNIQMYNGFWKVSNIEIRKIYPKTIPYKEIECTSTNYPECNYVKIMTKAENIQDIGEANFVALCRKVKYNDEAVNKCEIGQLIVRYEGVKK